MKIFKCFNRIAVCAFAALSLSACDSDVFDINSDPFKGQNYVNILNSPISVYLDGEPDFTEYVKALRYSDTYNALNQSTDGVSFTAFAPNNEAMQEFYGRRGVSSLEELTKDYVRSFVLYHTLPDSLQTETFITKTSVTNLVGEQLSVAIDSTNAGEATLNGEGQIVQMGISAYNGKIYVLSKAMTPLVENVFERIVEAGDSKIMADAIRATGWDKDLSVIADTIVEDGIKKINKRYYTVLNVSDEVFGRSNIGNLDQLKGALAAANADRGLDVDSLLREYVAYHIISNIYKTSELGGVTTTDTRIWDTAAKNQVLTMRTDTLAAQEADRYILNEDGVSAKFIPEESNVRAKNGYVHRLTSWLPVWEPKQSVIVWDLGDYTEIKNMVAADEYQPAEAPSTETRTRVATAACFTYEMSESGSSNNSYSDIDYVTSKSYKIKNEATGKMEEVFANNNDKIVFNVGYMGSVQMPTPTIVKGKYKVEISIIYTATQSFMRQQTKGNGGLLRMSFDDTEESTVFVAPYTKVPSALPGIYTSTIYDEIEFTETAAHNFKFVVLDPAASSEKGFSLQFDCITFTPIEE
ncbi:MAG: DUF5108 domain-containing protein [Prevotella sp.]|nr:DUF5108 domain-containing protein [Prevotella sp.]